MTLKKLIFGIIGLVTISSVRIVDTYSPGLISDFYLGFFSGFSFVFIAVYLVTFGSDLYKKLSRE
jgi:hypothetical protein